MRKHGIFGSDKARKRQSGRFETSPFDPETHYAVIRSSICTGEKVAGFRDKRDGHFTEVMLIRTPKDEQEFRERYNVDTLCGSPRMGSNLVVKVHYTLGSRKC